MADMNDTPSVQFSSVQSLVYMVCNAIALEDEDEHEDEDIKSQKPPNIHNYKGNDNFHNKRTNKC